MLNSDKPQTSQTGSPQPASEMDAPAGPRSARLAISDGDDLRRVALDALRPEVACIQQPLSSALAEELRLRESARAALAEELRLAKFDLDNARVLCDGAGAISHRNMRTITALADIIRPALRPELRGSPSLALDEALREELRLREAERTAALVAAEDAADKARDAIALREASLRSMEQELAGKTRALEVERLTTAALRRDIAALGAAIVEQARMLAEAGASARAYADIAAAKQMFPAAQD